MSLLVVGGLAVGLTGCVGAPPQPCTTCNDVCVDTNTDSANCGACGTVCAGGSRCEAGGCVSTGATCSLNCGPNGSCRASGTSTSCVCSPGYTSARCDSCASGFQDNDGDGTCVPDCDGVNCANGAACDASSGKALCACTSGYAGPTCTLCAVGYQDNDQNGTCVTTCNTAMLSCGPQGTCSDSSGTPTCRCALGSSGAGCTTCTTGFQDADGDGTCAPDCTTLSCVNGGLCSTSTGTARCNCAAGYAGPSCALCSAGFQDNDGDGTCTANCLGAALSCANGGACSDLSGTAACACAAGYTGATCATCAAGYQDDDGDSTCALACTTSPIPSTLGAPRLALRVPNPAPGALALDSQAYVTLPRDIASSWLDGGLGPSLVFHQTDGGVTPVARSVAINRSSDGGVINATLGFRLEEPIASGATSTSYALYRSSANAVAAATTPGTVLPTSRLVCDVRSEFFFSIQLRQVGPQLYEVNVGDGTGDSTSMARIEITDVATGAILKNSTYGNGAGTCCTAPTVIVTERLTITSPLFKVRMETREFSGSVRFFGCDSYGTGNPPTSQLGVSEFIFSTASQSSAAEVCGK